MQIMPTPLEGVRIIEPDVHKDSRGFFMEIYHRDRYRASGIDCVFVQDNLSYSIRGTLRGLHYQHPNAQAKLVQVLMGEVFDVAVDVRRGSETFGRWTGVRLSEQNRRQLFLPEGFAHGFCVLSESALFKYTCTDVYTPECEQAVLWCDPDIGIAWPLENPLLSEKDRQAPRLRDIPPDRIPPNR
ncbi:MAG: dTDP-4-dehydrorhamnose 3,5-epimerase [Desulfobacteraceae bacterium]|jgi:dTDP-4-dehydrorhamnose 3,5-epimerase